MRGLFLVMVCLFIGLCQLSSQTIFEEGQDEPKIAFKDRLYYGGNIGLQFGSLTYINVSPLIGLKLTDRYSTGIQASYQYFSAPGTGFSSSIYGGSVFNRFMIFEGIFAHGEVQLLNGKWRSDAGRYTLTNVYVGGGYNYAVSGSVGLFGLILYNLNQTFYNPFANPQINFGMTYGF